MGKEKEKLALWREEEPFDFSSLKGDKLSLLCARALRERCIAQVAKMQTQDIDVVGCAATLEYYVKNGIDPTDKSALNSFVEFERSVYNRHIKSKNVEA